MLIKKTLVEFINETASDSPAPGGGSVSALAGALAAALGQMVTNLTIGKKAYNALDEADQNGIKQALEELKTLQLEMIEAIDRDTDAFNSFMDALRMPKETEEEKSVRKEAMQKAAVFAMEVPLQTARLSLSVMKALPIIARFGNKNALSDVGVAAWLGRTAAAGSILNVRINLPGIDDEKIKAEASEEIKVLQDEVEKLFHESIELMEERLA